MSGKHKKLRRQRIRKRKGCFEGEFINRLVVILLPEPELLSEPVRAQKLPRTITRRVYQELAVRRLPAIGQDTGP